MTKFSQSVINRIKKEKLRPRRHLVFVARNIILWVLAVSATFAAALFFGTQLADLISTDWNLASRWPGGRFGLLHTTISWLWVVGIAIGLAGAAFFFRQTKRGYRYGAVFIAAALLGTMLVAGVSLTQTSLPRHFQTWHERQFPAEILAPRFHAPTEGRLLGELYLVDETVYLEAITGETWELWLLVKLTVLPEGLTAVFGEALDAETFAVIGIQPLPPRNFVKDLPRLLRTTQ